MDIESYLIAHTDEEPAHLALINRKTHLQMLNPRMLSGHLQGRLLSMLSKMIRPEKILELGTFTGYSALCLAEGLVENGVLHTIECDDELEDFIRANLQLTKTGEKVILHIGDALEILAGIDERFDLVFIDADKRDYSLYFEAVLPKVNSGGFLLIDNTLWDGKVLHDVVAENDEQTLAIQSFNDQLALDRRVDKLILPFRDGLTMVRKK
jgi:predicted O-methyltransferase YrrM